MHILSKGECIRIDLDETECMFLMVKEEKAFDKYMEIWGKVSN